MLYCTVLKCRLHAQCPTAKFGPEGVYYSISLREVGLDGLKGAHYYNTQMRKLGQHPQCLKPSRAQSLRHRSAFLPEAPRQLLLPLLPPLLPPLAAASLNCCCGCIEELEVRPHVGGHKFSDTGLPTRTVVLRKPLQPLSLRLCGQAASCVGQKQLQLQSVPGIEGCNRELLAATAGAQRQQQSII